jgi:ferrochelatase
MDNKIKTGVLLVNLGTPDSPSTSDVRKYLLEFLLDKRVIDISWLGRQLLVRGIIAPFRAPKSAKSYKEIWGPEGSPLLRYSRELSQLLQAQLGEDYVVALAMRYGNPSIESAWTALRKNALQRLIVVPLFPQYASASTGSVIERVMEVVGEDLTLPELVFIRDFHDLKGMIDVYAKNAEVHSPKTYDHILFSFHGLPVRQLIKSDLNHYCQQKEHCCENWGAHNQHCYGAQCTRTAHLIAERMGLTKDRYSICYQSRLGKTPWIQPYTSDVIEKLAKKGAKRLLVLCPAFVSDCLETIFEIGVEYQEEFQHAGGEKVTLVESLNVHPDWVESLAELVKNRNKSYI